VNKTDLVDEDKINLLLKKSVGYFKENYLDISDND
jgi:hypothetical protein